MECGWSRKADADIRHPGSKNARGSGSRRPAPASPPDRDSLAPGGAAAKAGRTAYRDRGGRRRERGPADGVEFVQASRRLAGRKANAPSARSIPARGWTPAVLTANSVLALGAMVEGPIRVTGDRGQLERRDRNVDRAGARCAFIDRKQSPCADCRERSEAQHESAHKKPPGSRALA